MRGWLGIASALLAIPMIVSGYLLQVAVEPVWRTSWIWVHGISSGFWLLAFLAHLPLFRYRRPSAM